MIYKKENIYIRNIIEEDTEPLRKMHNDPSTLYMLTDTTIVTPEMQKKWFNSIYESEKSKRYSICMNEDGRENLIGMIRFDQIDKINKNMIVGLDIMVKYRGQGLGKKSFNTMMEYCYKKLGMHKLTLYVAEYNNIAISLYLSLGFHKEGLLKEHLLRDNEYNDLLIMSAYKKEFEE